MLPSLSIPFTELRWEKDRGLLEKKIKLRHQIYPDDSIFQVQWKCGMALDVPAALIYLYGVTEEGEMVSLTHRWHLPSSSPSPSLSPEINHDPDSLDYELFAAKIDQLGSIYEDRRGDTIGTSFIEIKVWSYMNYSYQLGKYAEKHIFDTCLFRYWPHLHMQYEMKSAEVLTPSSPVWLKLIASDQHLAPYIMRADENEEKIRSMTPAETECYVLHVISDVKSAYQQPFINTFQLYQLLTMILGPTFPYVRITSRGYTQQRIYEGVKKHVGKDSHSEMMHWFDVGSRAGNRITMRYLLEEGVGGRPPRYMMIDLSDNGNVIIDMQWSEDNHAKRGDYEAAIRRVGAFFTYIDEQFSDYHILGVSRSIRIPIPDEKNTTIRSISGFSLLKNPSGEPLDAINSEDLFNKLSSYDSHFWANRRYRVREGSTSYEGEDSRKFTVGFKRSSGFQSVENIVQLLNSTYRRTELKFTQIIDPVVASEKLQSIFQMNADYVKYAISQAENLPLENPTNNFMAALNDFNHPIGIPIDLLHVGGKWFKIEMHGLTKFSELGHISQMFNRIINQTDTLTLDLDDWWVEDEEEGREKEDELNVDDFDTLADMERKYKELPADTTNTKIDRLINIKSKKYGLVHDRNAAPINGPPGEPPSKSFHYSKTCQKMHQPIAMSTKRAKLFGRILDARLRENPGDEGLQRLKQQYDGGRYYNLTANIHMNISDDPSRKTGGLYSTEEDALAATPGDDYEEVVFLACFEAYDWVADRPLTRKEAETLKKRPGSNIYLSTTPDAYLVGPSHTKARPCCYKPKQSTTRFDDAPSKISSYVQQGTKINLGEGKMGELPPVAAKFFNDGESTEGYIRVTKVTSQPRERMFLEMLAKLSGGTYNDVRMQIINYFREDITRYKTMHNGLWPRLFAIDEYNDGYDIFMDYISDFDNVLDEYMIWDVVCQPGVIFPEHINIFIFDLAQDGGLRLLCPKGYLIYDKTALSERKFMPIYRTRASAQDKDRNIFFFRTDSEMQVMVSRRDPKRHIYPHRRVTLDTDSDHSITMQKLSLILESIINCESRPTSVNTVGFLRDRIEGNLPALNVPPIGLETFKSITYGDIVVNMQLTDRNMMVVMVAFEYEDSVLFLPIEPSVPDPTIDSAPLSEYSAEDFLSLEETLLLAQEFSSVYNSGYRPFAIIYNKDITIGVEFMNGLYVGCSDSVPLVEVDTILQRHPRLKTLAMKEWVYDFRKLDLDTSQDPGEDERTSTIGRLLFERESYQLIRFEMSHWLANHPDDKKRITDLIERYEADKSTVDEVRAEMNDIVSELLSNFVVFLPHHPDDPESSFLNRYSTPPIRQHCYTATENNEHCVNNKLFVFETNLMMPDVLNSARYVSLLADELLRSPFLRDEILDNLVTIIVSGATNRDDVAEYPVAEEYKGKFFQPEEDVVRKKIRETFKTGELTDATRREYLAPLNPIDHRFLMNDIFRSTRNCYEVFRGSAIAQWNMLAANLSRYYQDHITARTMKERLINSIKSLSGPLPNGVPWWKIHWRLYRYHWAASMYSSLELKSEEDLYRLIMHDNHPITIGDLVHLSRAYSFHPMFFVSAGTFYFPNKRIFTGAKNIVVVAVEVASLPGNYILSDVRLSIVANVCSYPVKIIYDRGSVQTLLHYWPAKQPSPVTKFYQDFIESMNFNNSTILKKTERPVAALKS